MHSDAMVKRVLKSEAIMADLSEAEPMEDHDHGIDLESDPDPNTMAVATEEELELQDVPYEETDDDTGKKKRINQYGHVFPSPSARCYVMECRPHVLRPPFFTFHFDERKKV